jgi:hypothetical protein
MDVEEELRASKRVAMHTHTIVPPSACCSHARTHAQDDFLNYLLSTTMSPELHIPCYGTVLSVRSDEAIPTVMVLSNHSSHLRNN